MPDLERFRDRAVPLTPFPFDRTSASCTAFASLGDIFAGVKPDDAITAFAFCFPSCIEALGWGAGALPLCWIPLRLSSPTCASSSSGDLSTESASACGELLLEVCAAGEGIACKGSRTGGRAIEYGALHRHHSKYRNLLRTLSAKIQCKIDRENRALRATGFL